jgi:hypothetical protein
MPGLTAAVAAIAAITTGSRNWRMASSESAPSPAEALGNTLHLSGAPYHGDRGHGITASVIVTGLCSV